MKNAVGVVGLGLIGGSMAKAIRASISENKQDFADKIYAADLNRDVCAKAADDGVIDGLLDENTFKECRLVTVAVPPKACISWIKEHARYLSGCVLVDLCGVKKSIYDEVYPLSKEYGFTYVGGHPMAGREVAGYENSSAELFKNASMILTPDDDTDKELISQLSLFYKALGFSKITLTTLEEHDRIIAYTSQLAHITSSAYIKSETAQRQSGFSAGSYRDMTRVARLDENMWTQLFMYNREPLIGELSVLIDNLNDFLDVLKSGDSDGLKYLLKRGRELKESAGGV